MIFFSICIGHGHVAPGYLGTTVPRSLSFGTFVNGTSYRHFHHIEVGNLLHGTNSEKLVKKEEATRIKDKI